MPRTQRIGPELLEAALDGLRHRLVEVNRNIAEVKQLLRKAPATQSTGERAPGRPRRRMSEAAKRRIAEAQRRRWAAFHAQKAKGR